MQQEKDILFFAPRWGSEHLPWEAFLDQVRSAGYDGVEWAIAKEVPTAEIERVWDLAYKRHLFILPQHFDTVTLDFNQHLNQFKAWFNRIEPFRPLKINTQTGRDFFSKARTERLIAFVRNFIHATRIPVSHETHRGKFSFAAHLTQSYLKSNPDLRLTLDLSHWITVAESLLEDQPQIMPLVTERTDHIHARIGHPQGPQVPDPRMDEWQTALNTHLHWWDKIVYRKRALKEQLTITTEFGPYPYMVNLPQTGKPIADQWEINVHMLNLLKARYCR